MEKPNLSYINTLSGGDNLFKEKLIAIIKKEFPIEQETYANNIKIKNFKEASENVHKIKHKITILGLEKSYAIAVNYENNLKEGKLEGKTDFDTILQLIAAYLTTL